jgi:quinol monooxygenase YgiN
MHRPIEQDKAHYQEDENMYGMAGKITANTGQRNTLVAALLEAAAVMEEMEGCKLYLVSLSPTDPDAIWITEVWSDQKAHQASLANEEIRAIIARNRPLIAAMEGVELEPVGGKGISL